MQYRTFPSSQKVLLDSTSLYREGEMKQISLMNPGKFTGAFSVEKHFLNVKYLFCETKFFYVVGVVLPFVAFIFCII